MTPTALPPPDEGVWTDLRHRYEKGEESVNSIAATIELSGIALSNKAKALGWKMRGKVKAIAKATRANAVESTSTTIKRLKDLLQNRIASLETQLDEIGKDITALSSEREIRSVNTLVRTLEKVLDLERKDSIRRKKTTREFKHFDEQQRAELAEKIGKIQADWDRGETGDAVAAGSSGGVEHPVAVLGAAKPAAST